MTEPLLKRAIDRANLLRRVAQVARFPEPEQVYGPAPITDPRVGDLATFEQRGKWRYGVVTAVHEHTAIVTFVTVAGLDKARRDAHYHQNVKLDGYAEQAGQRARTVAEDKARKGNKTEEMAKLLGQRAYDLAFAAAFVERHVHEFVTTEPWVAWAPIVEKTIDLDELVVIRD